MTSQTILLRALAVAAALAASAASAQVEAADLGSLFSDGSPPPLQPVEFGTGWYIRGDVAYANDSLPNVSPDLSQFVSSSRQTALNADLGFGYKFNNWLRSDLVVDYWRPIDANGTAAGQQCVTQVTTINNIPTDTAFDTCTPHYSSSIQTWDSLANLYADIGTWYGFTPYIGAGAGVSRTQVSSSVHWFMSNGLPYQVSTDGFYFDWDRSESTLRYQFAWALMAGFSYAFTPQVMVDLGYRYINLGTITGIADPSGDSFSKTIDAHEVRLGMRYLID